MEERSIRLGPREQQITELLLQGCDNSEIAKQLKMARRTVKAHFNRLFLRFGISGGIKRVKLATLLYRRQLCSEVSAMENGFPVDGSNSSSSSLLKASKTGKSRKVLEPLNTLSKTTFAPSTTSSDSGTASNLPCGTRPGDTNPQSKHDLLENWERNILDLDLDQEALGANPPTH
jgi:hypothetical protein